MTDNRLRLDPEDLTRHIDHQLDMISRYRKLALELAESATIVEYPPGTQLSLFEIGKGE